VQVFGLDGSFVRQWGSFGVGQGQLRYPIRVVASGGEVFVLESFNHRVQVFDLDGTFLRQLGSRGDYDGQFDYPDGLAVSDGEVFVSDSRVQVVTQILETG
jgi:hypothetical protein